MNNWGEMATLLTRAESLSVRQFKQIAPSHILVMMVLVYTRKDKAKDNKLTSIYMFLP